MSQYLNGQAKGRFFPDQGSFVEASFLSDPDYLISNSWASWRWPSAEEDLSRSIYSANQALDVMYVEFEKALYGTLEMSADMRNLIDKTNNRIYGAL